MSDNFIIEKFLNHSIKLTGDSLEEKRTEIIKFFHSTFTQYERLFEMIADEGFYIRAEPLRHPLIFYYGHTASFIINKLLVKGFKIQRINPFYESITAVGVDEMSWDDLNTEHVNWPKVSELKEYRNKVRNFFDNFLRTVEFSLPINWESPMWIAIMICEHERIHLETSSVILRRLPLHYFKSEKINYWLTCEEYRNNLEEVPENQFLKIEGSRVNLGKDDSYYGWDNEYGSAVYSVKDFQVHKYLTTNKEYLDFINDNGYSREEFWTEEGKNWLKYQVFNRPIFWSEDLKELRLLNKVIKMPWDWPVEVNYLEAKAYANWYSKVKGEKVRLLTEEEWHILRGVKETYDFQANICLSYYASSCPVDKFQHERGVFDVVGNVWQWTETPIDGFEGFKVHPCYKDFSSPTFDGKHNIIKGGSWISTGNESIKASRYAFRRHFFQHAGFRLVKGDEIHYDKVKIEKEPEIVKWLGAEFDSKMYEKFKIEPFTKTILEEVKKFTNLENHFVNSKQENILVLGCKSGALSFGLLNVFQTVIGMDQTANNFRVGVDLLEGSKIKYSEREEGDINDIKELEFNYKSLDFPKSKKINFFQTDLYNDIDVNKFKEIERFDSILIQNVDNFELIDGMSLLKVVKKGGLVFVMVPKGKQVKPSQFNDKYFKKLNRISNTLNPLDHNILFRETARKHRLEVYNLEVFLVEERLNAENYFETDFICEQYIRFHYSPTETFPTTCAKFCIEALESLNIPCTNALDLGCSLGQTSFVLSKNFQTINAIDYSIRFIEIANERKKMLQNTNINFMHGSVLDMDKFENLPRDNTLVFCGNLIDRLSNPKQFLNDIHKFIKEGGILVLTSPYTWLEESTPKDNWLGGYIKNGEIITTIFGIEEILKDYFEKIKTEDLHFVIPDFPPFSYQTTSAQLSIWKRKDFI